MEHYLSGLDIDVYICLDFERSAEGVEKVMLDAFHATSTEQLSGLVRPIAGKALRKCTFRPILENQSDKVHRRQDIHTALFQHFYQCMGRTGGQQMSSLIPRVWPDQSIRAFLLRDR